MKYTLLIILVLFLASCEKYEKNEVVTNYDFKIIRDHKIDYIIAAFQDSSIYLYSSDYRLKKYEKYLNELYYSYNVTYESDRIIHVDGTYYLSDGDRIDSLRVQNSESVKIGYVYEYVDDKLVYEEHFHPDYHSMTYYKYKNGIHVKDSIIRLANRECVTVITYDYTDTLKPFFMIDESGLFEYPQKSENLVREENVYNIYVNSVSGDPPISVFSQKFNYDITDNRIVQTSVLNDTIIETITYLFIEKE